MPTTSQAPESHSDPLAWLRQEYEQRRQKNPYYSQRAFSRLIGVPSGRLSELWSRKRALSPRLGQQIFERLELAPGRRQQFLQSLRHSRRKTIQCRKIAALAGDSTSLDDYSELSNDVFYVISDWYHLAILSLVRTDAFRNDTQWIAKRLGISGRDVKLALERLERLGLLERDGKKLRRARAKWKSSHDVPSTALRHAHRQGLELAIQALEEVPVEKRDITSMTMAISPAKLTQAKKMIRNFRRGLSDLLEEGEREEVYNLTVALFPLTKGKAR